MGTPDYAAVELVRASLEAGTTDNVTCVVADIVDEDELPGEQQPMLVGAAADLKRRSHLPTMPHLFRGHRAGDTGELEPVRAEIPDDVAFAIETDPVDPEEARYAPRPPRRFLLARRILAALAVLGVVWIVGGAAYSWTQQQYYVGDDEGIVTIFRGVDADLPGVRLSRPFETTNVTLDRLSDYDASTVREGIDADSLDDAKEAVRRLAANQTLADETETSGEATATATATATPSPSASDTATPTDTASPSPSTASASP
jgi:PPM family protein phosphatase